MRTRFLSNLALTLLGGFVVVTSQAFGVPTFEWLMLGGGIAALLLAAPGLALASRGIAQRGLDGATTILGAWTIIASMVFAGATVTWLGFASGLAFVALAIAGLALHELRTERVVHSFEISGTSTAEYRDLTGVAS